MRSGDGCVSQQIFAEREEGCVSQTDAVMGQSELMGQSDRCSARRERKREDKEKNA